MSGASSVVEVDVGGVLGRDDDGVEAHGLVVSSYSMVTWVLPSGRR